MDCLSRRLTKTEYERQIKGFQISNEGLSINHLHFTDDTILAKWIWRDHQEEKALWRNLIKAKYTPTSNKNHPSIIYKRALEVHKETSKSHHLTNRTRHKVGNGRSTSFWTDPWIENTTLALKYPLLYRLSLSKKATIKEMWNVVNKFWDLKLGRNLKDNEAMEWAELSLDLAPVVLSNKEDSLTWLPMLMGSFLQNP